MLQIRVFFRSVLLLAFIGGAPVAGQTTPVSRQWALHPAIVEAAAAKRIYALGDVHGDYERLVALLVGTKVIPAAPATPEAARWSAGDAVLVCTGDMIDKWSQSLQVIRLMQTLQARAAEAGGRVIVTLGNHEAEFLARDGIGKKSEGFEQELGAAGSTAQDVAEGRDAAGVGAWLRDLPAGAKVGDWFFCHAGNTGGMTLAELSERIRSEVTASGWSARVLADPNSLLEARMHPRPWWDADGSEPGLKDVKPHVKHKKVLAAAVDPAEQSAEEQRLLKVVEAVGAHHLVFGHQPGKIRFLDGTERGEGEMYGKYNGLVFMIDTGMSRGVQGGRGALLLVSPGGDEPSATAVYADGTSTVLWK